VRKGASKRVVIVGGGTGGCALTGHLLRLSNTEVVLLEAGPDYGPRTFVGPQNFSIPAACLQQVMTGDSGMKIPSGVAPTPSKERKSSADVHPITVAVR